MPKKRSLTTRKKMSIGWYKKRMRKGTDAIVADNRVNVRLSSQLMAFLLELCAENRCTCRDAPEIADDPTSTPAIDATIGPRKDRFAGSSRTQRMKIQLQEVLDAINKAAAPYRPKRTVIIQHIPEEAFALDLTFPNSLAMLAGGTHQIEESIRQAVLVEFGEAASVEVLSREYRQLNEGPESRSEFQ